MDKDIYEDLVYGMDIVQVKRYEIMSSEELHKYICKGYTLITIANLTTEDYRYLYVFIIKGK
jgi:hypothetical protein